MSNKPLLQQPAGMSGFRSELAELEEFRYNATLVRTDLKLITFDEGALLAVFALPLLSLIVGYHKEPASPVPSPVGPDRRFRDSGAAHIGTIEDFE